MDCLTGCWFASPGQEAMAPTFTPLRSICMETVAQCSLLLGGCTQPHPLTEFALSVRRDARHGCLWWNLCLRIKGGVERVGMTYVLTNQLSAISSRMERRLKLMGLCPR